MISCNMYSIPLFGINLNILECKYMWITLLSDHLNVLI